jgi:aspartyl-tRNA(Asn)/glutamyl-tRNA(Gln) amidotransferase subunit B
MSVAGFDTVIGLEVHVQLGLRTKLFSASPNDFGAEPNTRVSSYDAALPGVLPVLNDAAIDLALRAALALGCELREQSRFERKNYFYPDLPKGYQISQYSEPYCVGGVVPLGDGRSGRLTRIHLEEDAGKTIHTDAGSLVDLNRAGVALIEIVGEPDLSAPADAAAFLQSLKQILQFAAVSDCDMERGSLRCDANVSLRPAGSRGLGAKVEIKNVNSIRMVQRALEYEERRQAALLAAGKPVRQETRGWHEERGETVALRSKESAHDYRYFPDPDLPPLVITPERIARVRAALPELPAARAARFAREYGLPDYDVAVLLQDRHVADWFETVARGAGDAKLASNWVMGEVLRVLNESGGSIREFTLPPQELVGLLQALQAGRVSHQAAKKVFQQMLATGAGTEAALAMLGLEQQSDPAQLRPVVAQVLAENAPIVAELRAGKQKARHALKGLVMRATKGRANPAVVDTLLADLLGP